jgi:hypothetical protein
MPSKISLARHFKSVAYMMENKKEKMKRTSTSQ